MFSPFLCPPPYWTCIALSTILDMHALWQEVFVGYIFLCVMTRMKECFNARKVHTFFQTLFSLKTVCKGIYNKSQPYERGNAVHNQRQLPKHAQECTRILKYIYPGSSWASTLCCGIKSCCLDGGSARFACGSFDPRL